METETTLGMSLHRDRMEKKINHIRANWERSKELLLDAILASCGWSEVEQEAGIKERCVSVHYSSDDYWYLNSVVLNLYLGPSDSISWEVLLFLEEHIEPLIEKHGLSSEVSREYEGAAIYDFWGNGKRLSVYANIENSELCRVVGTGTFTEPREITRLVCV
jgi:hypothetical protein